MNKINKSKRILIRVLLLMLLTFSMASITACEKSPLDRLSDTLKVHFINVGQGEAILIQCDGKNMLIDAGSNDKGELVKEYLKNEDVEKLDYVTGTHPHEDHIGGLDFIIDNFDIGKVIMPKVTANTRTFKDVINSIKNKNLKIKEPKVGTSYSLGNASWEIIAPNSSNYESINNYSICIKLTYGYNSFLFTGDAEALSEEEMIKSGIDLSADLLKIGHHGSNSSTTEEFLTAVKPRYAVLSVETPNDYGHPHREVMKRLMEDHIPLLRTDQKNSIRATSNGEQIIFNCSPGGSSKRYQPGNDSVKNILSEVQSSEIEESIESDYSVEITDIDRINEIVTIKNNSNKDVNLDGWTLFSVTGNQKYVFDDYIIKAGDSITVASGKSDGDIKWSKAYIWNNTSEDIGQLINSKGIVVSSF